MNKTAAASNQDIYYTNLNYNRTITCAKLATHDIVTLKTRVIAVAAMVISAIRETFGIIVYGTLNYGIQLYNYLTTKNVTVETEKTSEPITVSETVTDAIASQFRNELATKPEERHLLPITEETSSQVASAASSAVIEEEPMHLDTLFAEPAEVTKDDVEEKRFELDTDPEVEEEAEKFFVGKRIDTMVVKVAKFFTSWKKAS